MKDTRCKHCTHFSPTKLWPIGLCTVRNPIKYVNLEHQEFFCVYCPECKRKWYKFWVKSGKEG